MCPVHRRAGRDAELPPACLAVPEPGLWHVERVANRPAVITPGAARPTRLLKPCPRGILVGEHLVEGAQQQVHALFCMLWPA